MGALFVPYHYLLLFCNYHPVIDWYSAASLIPKDALAATVAASVRRGTMKSLRKNESGDPSDPTDQANASTVPADDATWVVETEDFSDPWALDATDWSANPEILAAQQEMEPDQQTSTPYYDYVADRRRSTLPYDHRGVAELYVEDLEFEPTEFNEYDDTAEFAY